VSALAAKIERICQQTGLEAERRAFHPHITLARWKGRSSQAADLFMQRHGGLSSAPFPVDRFTLFESHLSRHGPRYEVVADYALA
jgi:2'-5' RNA ligase